VGVVGCDGKGSAMCPSEVGREYMRDWLVRQRLGEGQGLVHAMICESAQGQQRDNEGRAYSESVEPAKRLATLSTVSACRMSKKVLIRTTHTEIISKSYRNHNAKHSTPEGGCWEFKYQRKHICKYLRLHIYLNDPASVPGG
jgi:hypothetical protein